MNINSLLATAAAVALATACATAGRIVPTVFTATGNEGPLVTSAGPTTYAADADGARMLDKVENRGDLDQLVLDMPQTEAELNALLAKISRHWPHPLPQAPRVKLTMIAQYSGATYADGTITIGIGTLGSVMSDVPGQVSTGGGKVVSSDEELQYLLGHEFGHYALGHHNKKDFMSSLISGTGRATKLYNQAAVLSELRYVGTGDNMQIAVEDEREVARKWNSSAGTYDFINTLASQALGPAWNRSQEDDADVLALDLLKADGVTGAFYESMFVNLKAHESFSEQTQSLLEASVTDVQAQFLAPDTLSQMLNGQTEQASSSILDRARQNLLAQGKDMLVGYLGQTHRPPEVRLKGVRSYEQNAYGLSSDEQEEALFLSEPSTATIDRIRDLAEFKNALAMTRAYYGSIASRSQGDLAAAEATISQALSIPGFGKQAALLFEAGRVAEAAGQPTLAIQRYQAASMTTPLPEAFRRLAFVQIRSGLYGDAEKTIASGAERLNDDAYFLPSQVRLAVAREQHDKAIEYLLICREQKNDDLIAACEAARAGVDFATLTPEQKAAYAKSGRLGTDGNDGFMKGVSNILGTGSKP